MHLSRCAEAGEKLAGERLLQVESEKKKTEEEKQIAVAVKDFLQNRLLGQADVTAQANALLAAGGPSSSAKKDPTIRELLDRAAELLSEAKIEASFPNQPLLQAEILLTVGDTYRGVGDSERAIGLLQRSLALRKSKLGPDHPDTLMSMHRLAAAYLHAGKLDLAVPLFEETLKLWRAKLGPENPNTLSTMATLGGLRLQKKNFGEAELLLRECLAIREKTQPDVWNTFNAQAMLGGALLGQQKYAEAEPLLLKGYQGMKRREKAITNRNANSLPDALDRLIELYTATSKPGEVKKWRAERAKYPQTKSPEKK